MSSTSGQSAIPGLRYSGFTLVEMMITVVILAILATIVYPSFMQSIRKANRIDAQTALTRTASNLQGFFATNGTYTTDTSQLGLIIDAGTAVSDNGHYVITVTAGTQPALAAATSSAQVQRATCRSTTSAA